MPRPSRTLGHHTQLVRLRPVKVSLLACHLPAQSASEIGAWAAWRRSDRWLGTRSTGLYAEAVWEARVLARDEVMVNSVHGQGVRRLAEGLRVEALAPDGLVEAFSVADSPGFALGVQWHPEWQAADNPVSMAMLRAFGAACQDYRDLHRPPSR